MRPTYTLKQYLKYSVSGLLNLTFCLCWYAEFLVYALFVASHCKTCAMRTAWTQLVLPSLPLATDSCLLERESTGSVTLRGRMWDSPEFPGEASFLAVPWPVLWATWLTQHRRLRLFVHTVAVTLGAAHVMLCMHKEHLQICMKCSNSLKEEGKMKKIF